MIKKLPILIAISLLLLMTTWGITYRSYAMDLFKGEELYYFSGFKATLLLNGEPVIGATVRRNAESKGKVVVDDSTVTDSEGNFEFTSVMKKTLTPNLFQFVSHQEIFVDYEDTTYHIWSAGKMLEADLAEFGGRQVDIICDLKNEAEPFYMDVGLGMTSCSWDGITRRKKMEIE